MRAGSTADVSGERQQLRAELEPGVLRDIEIDVETDPAALHEQLRDAAPLHEVVEVADGQHMRPSHHRHDGREHQQYFLFDDNEVATQCPFARLAQSKAEKIENAEQAA